MRILVTRSKGDAEETAAKLEGLGHQPIVAPLLEIAFASGPEIVLDNVQAVVVTSANGIRALAGRTRRRDVRVMAVGLQSAAAARALGFANVESADGDADALIALVAAALAPENGALLHASAKDTRGDVVPRLRAKGFEVTSEVLYEAVGAKRLPLAARRALSAHALDAALFYSPRTARIFSELLHNEGLASECERVRALCISRATANALASIRFRDVGIAERPNEERLFDVI